jgi:hypothetical protein
VSVSLRGRSSREEEECTVMGRGCVFACLMGTLSNRQKGGVHGLLSQSSQRSVVMAQMTEDGEEHHDRGC